jgi:hypothetical protein
MTIKSVPLNLDYSKLQTYHVRDVIILRYLILAILGVLGELVIILIGLNRWRFVLTNFGPAVVWRWISPFLWVGLGFGLLGTIALTLLLRTNRQEIQISPEAFTWRKGRNLSVHRWEDIQNIFITSIRYGILDFEWAKKTEVILHLDTGKRIRINQVFENIERLVDTIKKYVYPIMFERFRHKFNNGEPLAFGPLLLTTQGVLNGRKTLRWQDIGEILVDRGSLWLRPIDSSGSSQLSIPTQKIPNIDLCVQLLHHFGPQS